MIIEPRLHDDTPDVVADMQMMRALEDDEFTVACQPQVSLATGAIVGVEALARWPVDDGVRMPGTFIPHAERSGLIVPLGARLLELAARRATVLGEVAAHHLFVTWVNVSAHQILDSDFTGLVVRTLDATGTPAQHLGVEITETVLLIDERRTGRVLGELRDLGLRIALDDFGTGYSSLRYLEQFDLDVLKLAREFIDGLPTSATDQAIVRSIVDVAQALGMETVAEGIETRDQLRAVRDAGCDVGQGYLLGRPMTAAAIKQLLVAEHDR